MTGSAYELLGGGMAAGYLLGSIPFGLLIGLSRGVDIRRTGSGNIGATNLARALGTRFFWYAFALDAAKGFGPTLVVSVLAGRWHLPAWLALLTGVAALGGHMFPVYLKFKGGKGVATSFGMVLGIWPVYTLAGLGAGVIFLLVFLLYRYISLSSIVAALGFGVLVALLGLSRASPVYQESESFRYWLLAAVLFALLIIVKHRGNIRRLLAGTEPKYGRQK